MKRMLLPLILLASINPAFATTVDRFSCSLSVMKDGVPFASKQFDDVKVDRKLLDNSPVAPPGVAAVPPDPTLSVYGGRAVIELPIPHETLAYQLDYELLLQNNGKEARAAQAFCNSLYGMVNPQGIRIGPTLCFFQPVYNPWRGDRLTGRWQPISVSREGVPQFDGNLLKPASVEYDSRDGGHYRVDAACRYLGTEF